MRLILIRDHDGRTLGNIGVTALADAARKYGIYITEVERPSDCCRRGAIPEVEVPAIRLSTRTAS